MISVLSIGLALLVLVLLVREFADADPIKAKAYPVRWHLWLASSVTLACGMLARVAVTSGFFPGSERVAALLTLTGVAVRIAINRRRGGNA